MSLQRCQAETTSTEFIDWMAYLENDVNAFHREDWFLANIAREIRVLREIIIGMFAKKAKSRIVVELEQFLLKFTTKKEAKKTTTEKEEVEKSERMKKWWLSWAGINTPKKNRKRKK
jgi:hypothetical protein